MKKIKINKQFSYLIIVTLIIVILFLTKLLLEYTLFNKIKIALFTIFFPFLISFFVVYIFHPILYWVEKKLAIKTWVSTLILLLINIVLIITAIEFLLPIITEQLKSILIELPKYVDEFEVILGRLQKRYAFLNNTQIYDSIIALKDTIVLKAADALVDFAISGIMFSVKYVWIIIIIPILIFMMMKDYSLLYETTSKFLVKHKRSEWIQLLTNIDGKLGAYIRGQLIIMGYMFVGTLVLLIILGMPNALIFAIIIALTNIIPYLGPYLGGFPLWIYAYFQSPYLFIGSIIVVIIMQQLDGNLGQPIVFGSQLKIHPLVIMAVMLIGSAFGGVLGLILSIPIYIVVSEVFSFFKPRFTKTNQLEKKPINQ